jgi:glycosyltransferase involved in cell wall biosynthesis
MDTRDVCVVVPAYNEAVVVPTVVASLRQRFEHVVCVDDGSSDGTGEAARSAGATVLRHPVNLGQGAALQTGFELVKRRPDVQYVVTFDADGQHCVDDAVSMVRLARRTGVDVVLGSRAAGTTHGQSAGKRLVLRAALAYSRAASGLDLTDTHNGLRVLAREALPALTLRQTGMAHASELESLIARHDLIWCEHPVNVRYTSYSVAKGQSSLNAFNVLYDLLTARLRPSP